MYLPGTIAKPNTRGSSTTFSKDLNPSVIYFRYPKVSTYHQQAGTRSTTQELCYNLCLYIKIVQ